MPVFQQDKSKPRQSGSLTQGRWSKSLILLMQGTFGLWPSSLAYSPAWPRAALEPSSGERWGRGGSDTGADERAAQGGGWAAAAAAKRFSDGISNQALNAAQIAGMFMRFQFFILALNLMVVMDIRADWTWLIIIITVIIVLPAAGCRTCSVLPLLLKWFLGTCSNFVMGTWNDSGAGSLFYFFVRGLGLFCLFFFAFTFFFCFYLFFNLFFFLLFQRCGEALKMSRFASLLPFFFFFCYIFPFPFFRGVGKT